MIIEILKTERAEAAQKLEIFTDTEILKIVFFPDKYIITAAAAVIKTHRRTETGNKQAILNYINNDKL